MLAPDAADRILREHGPGGSFASIARTLSAEGVATAQGGARWHASTVRAIVCSRTSQGLPMSEVRSPNADLPIASSDADLLDRGGLVDRLVAQARRAPADAGFVIGLSGAWGSGKTSLLNLVEERLGTDTVVLHFEPWMFTGAEQLVARFFEELAEQLKSRRGKRLHKLGERLSDYGAAIAPAASVLMGPAGGLATMPEQLLERHRGSALIARERLRKQLAERPERIVVIVDDVDRLTSPEIREVVRLVKLVGDLPGVVYLLAYERSRVERALSAHGARDGRSYLEKIVQAPFSLPPTRRERVVGLTFAWLDEVCPRTR